MFGAEVAWEMRSAAARGEVADLERRMKDSRAFRAFCWSGSIGEACNSNTDSFNCIQQSCLRAQLANR